MPILLLFALAGSLAIHGVALFGTDVELFGGGQELPPLQAEIRPPPSPPPAPEPPRRVARPPVKKVPPPVVAAAAVVGNTNSVPPEPPVADSAAEIAPEIASTVAVTPAAPAAPVKAILPASGTIRFAIFKESLGLQIGRAEHHWEFSEDGRYRLQGMTETSGLAALLRPVRLELESTGRLGPNGLVPETFRTVKNGRDANENADFDWSTAAVRLSRDGSVQPVAAGTQDILSLNYQLAYLKRPDDGSSIGVVTGKKYDRYALDSLGEEVIETPAGRFRTLHLRATTDNTTEIWIALDRHRLPVKIRFTDKKGESFEQIATELGM